MIIIYGYFIRKMTKIIKSKFILPLNLSYDISQMLKGQKIFFDDFHFLTFINQKDTKIINYYKIAMKNILSLKIIIINMGLIKI